MLMTFCYALSYWSIAPEAHVALFTEMSATNFTKLFEFFSLIGQLKRVHRTGWVLRHVSDPESVADHMYRMAMMAFLVDSRAGINKERCIKLALVHDMAESIVGDIAPSDCMDKEEKHQKEKTAMTHICGLVSEEVGIELKDLWMEYEEQKTAESHFVKDLDKFEMVLQAFEYEQLDSKPNSLQEFFDSTEGKFKTDTVRHWVSELEKIRSQTSSQHFTSPHVKRENSPTRNSARVKPFMHSE